MKKNIVIILLMAVIVISLFSFKDRKTQWEIETKTYLESTDSYLIKEKALEALEAVARSYYYRGKDIQYLANSLTYLGWEDGTTGHSYHQIPESATDQNILSLDCSSFIYLLFEKTFLNKNSNEGYKLGNYEATQGRTKYLINVANPDASSPSNYIEEVGIYYKSEIGILSNEEKNIEKQKIEELLQPGDVIVYTQGTYDSDNNFVQDSSGHAILYLGGENNNVINSSQTVNGYQALTYDFEKKQITYNPKGTVGYVDLNRNILNYTNGEINKYLFSKSIYNLSILRPFNEIAKENSEYIISNDALNRMKYPDLVINKTASVNKHDSVNLGDSITYKIKLENKSTTLDYQNIEVTDEIPQNTNFIDLTGNGSIINNKLKWTINIEKGKTKEISYTVKVSEDLNVLNTFIISDKTKVNNISINKIETYVNPTLTKDEQEKIVKIAKKKIGETVEDNIVNLVYKEYDKNNNLFENKSVDDIFNDVYDISEINTKELKLKPEKFGTGTKQVFKIKNNILESTYGKMYVKDLFGGIFTIDEALTSDNEDSREIRLLNNTLTVGDVLLLYDDDYETDNYVAGEKNMYLYIGNNEFITVDPVTKKVILLDDKSEETKTIYENGTSRKETIITDRSRLLDSLLAQNTFIVLRPSYSLKLALITSDDNIVDDSKNNLAEDENINSGDNPYTGENNFVYIALIVICFSWLIYYVINKKKLN